MGKFYVCPKLYHSLNKYPIKNCIEGDSSILKERGNCSLYCLCPFEESTSVLYDNNIIIERFIFIRYVGPPALYKVSRTHRIKYYVVIALIRRCRLCKQFDARGSKELLNWKDENGDHLLYLIACNFALRRSRGFKPCN